MNSSIGGDTIQVHETANFLRKIGVKVDIKLSNEQIDYSTYDILHFFNIIRPADILKHSERCILPFVVSTIFVDYEEFERNNRTGIFKWINNFISSDSTEYLKALARLVLNGEKVASLKYLVWGHRKSIQYIMTKASMLLPNSESEYIRLSAKYNKKAPHLVIPNGINTSKFTSRSAANPDRHTVICVGRIEARKNQYRLIKALNILGYPAYIIGNPSPNSKHYYQQCKEIANSNINFISHLNQDDLAEHYLRAKVHALPSWFETTGLSSLEAAFMGCNIVVSPNGDTKDYFKNYASYCSPNSIESIKSALKTEYNKPIDPEFREYIKRNYTWDVTAEKTLEAYEQVLNI